MNKIVRDTFTASLAGSNEHLSLEQYQEQMGETLDQLERLFARHRRLGAMKSKLVELGGVNRTLAMESCEDAPEILTVSMRTFSTELSNTNYAFALEAVENAQKTVMQRIREFIKKIIDFAIELFGRLKSYVENFFSQGEQNKRSLNETQRLLDMAKKESSKERVATEGFSTGTIPIQAPKFLHLEYQRIVAETAKLEVLAAAFIKNTVTMLALQFKHCKHVIEAYNKLLNGADGSLQEFDHTCEAIVRDGERKIEEIGQAIKVFDCIEIVEEIRDNQYAGVLKYRVSIKPPGKEDMAYQQGRFTTNLMRAQDLQDRLVKLNDEIVVYAKQIKEFFAVNAKTFLDTLVKLNRSANSGQNETFQAHSEYVTQVHTFLVRGNLIQVVLGLNVLNTVWKAVHNLNTQVVKEFLAN